MTNETDHHVGKRLRRRRRLLGLTQQQLAECVGVRFQQIQKYECGANRVSASRLYELSTALTVPVNYFYDGLEGDPTNDAEPETDMMSRPETRELLSAYYQLGETPRRRLLDLAKSMRADPAGAAA